MNGNGDDDSSKETRDSRPLRSARTRDARTHGPLYLLDVSCGRALLLIESRHKSRQNREDREQIPQMTLLPNQGILDDVQVSAIILTKILCIGGIPNDAIIFLKSSTQNTLRNT